MKELKLQKRPQKAIILKTIKNTSINKIPK